MWGADWIAKLYYLGKALGIGRQLCCRHLPSERGLYVFCLRKDDLMIFYGLDRRIKDLTVWHRVSGWSWDSSPYDVKARIVMSVLKKASESKAGTPGRVTPDERFIKRWPGLWEHLTATQYPDDGGPRKTSTFSVFLGSQGLTASLNDRDNSRSCFANGTTLEKLLDALEAVCSAEETVWREDRNQTGSSARKK